MHPRFNFPAINQGCVAECLNPPEVIVRVTGPGLCPAVIGEWLWVYHLETKRWRWVVIRAAVETGVFRAAFVSTVEDKPKVEKTNSDQVQEDQGAIEEIEKSHFLKRLMRKRRRMASLGFTR